jgi:hypothetical protein
LSSCGLCAFHVPIPPADVKKVYTEDNVSGIDVDGQPDAALNAVPAGDDDAIHGPDRRKATKTESAADLAYQHAIAATTALGLIDLRGLLSTEIAIFKGLPESTTAMFVNSASASPKQANVRRNIPECRRLITQSSIQCTENKARSKNHQADVLREAREAEALRS